MSKTERGPWSDRLDDETRGQITARFAGMDVEVGR